MASPPSCRRSTPNTHNSTLLRFKRITTRSKESGHGPEPGPRASTTNAHLGAWHRPRAGPQERTAEARGANQLSHNTQALTGTRLRQVGINPPSPRRAAPPRLASALRPQKSESRSRKCSRVGIALGEPNLFSLSTRHLPSDGKRGGRRWPPQHCILALRQTRRTARVERKQLHRPELKTLFRAPGRRR